jgi:hypothetical protein
MLSSPSSLISVRLAVRLAVRLRRTVRLYDTVQPVYYELYSTELVR